MAALAMVCDCSITIGLHLQLLITSSRGIGDICDTLIINNFPVFLQISMSVLPAMVAVVTVALMWMAPSLAAARVGFCSTLMEEHVMVSQYKNCINFHCPLHIVQCYEVIETQLFVCFSLIFTKFFDLILHRY